MKNFTRILIANRGEIACRIMRTAKAMGYGTVAVYSDADRDALHVSSADEAVRIGPPPVRESYLDITALLAAAKLSGADAVHPGYGFLSENEEFAAACEGAGLVFIGPPAAAIHAMGNKAAAKRLMIDAKVPCVPGYQGADQSDDTLIAEANRIGYPVMVKAAAGGGGRGMRLVDKADGIARAISTARSEATNAFGSGELILEKAVVDARHIEIQVFADAHGNVIHLGERDCSVQRRHQKVIEEAPSPAVSPELRAQMGEAAVQAARAIDYRGAGTVEFLLDGDGKSFYFLEMNTRLQVEHPVTEAITGLDLVAWQLRVAAGEKLPLTQEQVTLTGHAIEVRLYAEDPTRNFLPQSGTIAAWRPAAGQGVRVDHGITSGWAVSPFYDPMLAKVIAHGATREEARRRLIGALQDSVLLGMPNNRNFLTAMLKHPAFIDGQATTGFIGAHFATGSDAMKAKAPSPRLLALAAALLFDNGTERRDLNALRWDSTGQFDTAMRLTSGKTHHAVLIRPAGDDAFVVTINGASVQIEILRRNGIDIRFIADGLQASAHHATSDGQLLLALGDETLAVRDTTLETGRAQDADGDARMLAPMNGRIVAVLAKAGDTVTKGQRIVVLEAMKMQHEIIASRAGLLEQVAVKEGDQVATRQLLAALKALEKAPA